VTYGLDVDTFETTGIYVLVPARVREHVERTLGEEQSPVVTEALQRLEAGDGSIDIGTDPGSGLPTVAITLRSSAKTIFARALPGGPDRLAVSARASAHVVIRG